LSIDWINFLFNENRIDAWISGMGSFLGALLAGLITAGIAIWIMKRQTDYDKKKETKKEINNLAKSFAVLHTWSFYALDRISEMKVTMDSNTLNQQNKDKMIDELGLLIDDVKKIEQIKDDYIPQEVYKEFLHIKQLIHQLIEDANQYIHKYPAASDLSIIFRHFDQCPKEIEKDLSIIKKFTEKQKEKLI
jgi:hypothetical protein